MHSASRIFTNANINGIEIVFNGVVGIKPDNGFGKVVLKKVFCYGQEVNQLGVGFSVFLQFFCYKSIVCQPCYINKPPRGGAAFWVQVVHFSDILSNDKRVQEVFNPGDGFVWYLVLTGPIISCSHWERGIEDLLRWDFLLGQDSISDFMVGAISTESEQVAMTFQEGILCELSSVSWILRELD